MGLAKFFRRRRTAANAARRWPATEQVWFRRWLRKTVVCAAMLPLAMLCFGAADRLADPPEDTGPALNPEQIASFTGPGDFQYELPRGVDITLDIIAGKAGPSRKKPGIESPVAAVTDAQDRLLVADAGTRAIIIFDFARHKYSEIELAKSGVRSIAGLAVDDKGDIFVTDSRQGRVFRFNNKGSFLGYLQPSRDVEAYYVTPMGIAIDQQRGYIYVCDWGRNMVVKLDRSGQALAEFGVRGGGSGPGEFKRPTQVAVVNGDLFVLDAGNKRIQRFDTDGKYLSQIRAPEGAGLAVDRWQRILLSQPSLHRIAVLSQDGRLLATFENGAGNRFDPSNLWLKSEHCLYVTDKANKSVELFRVGGNPEKSCYE
jgi:DNA-binding beta-propeller fold protein YncE